MKNRHLITLTMTLTAFASIAVAGEKQFAVADFGAIPNDDRDDRAAIQKAIDAATAAGDATVTFEKGTYHLDATAADKPGDYLLRIRKAAGITLAGNGAELIVRSPVSGVLKTEASADVTVQDFVIDYDPLPFTIARVVEVDGDAIITEAVPGYPTPDDPMFDGVWGWGYFLDPDVPGKLGDNMPNVVFDEERAKLADGRFRVLFKKGTGRQLDAVLPGTYYTRIVKLAQLFLSNNTRNLTFRGITSYASPSGHYVGSDLENVRVEDCHELIKPGRHKGGNADGFHLQNVRGGITIRNCTVEGISDDCVNLYQKPHHILSRESATCWRFSSNPDRFLPRSGPGNLQAGDLLHAFDGETGENLGRVRLVQYDPKTGEAEIDGKWSVPQDPARWKTILLYSDAFGSDALIENNTFKHSRRFGVLLKSHRTRVRNNRFIGLSSSAFYASNDTQHNEGGFCGDLIFEDNVIINCGFDRNHHVNESLATITLTSIKGRHVPTGAENLHRDITIRNNRIEGPLDRFHLANTDGLVVEGNTWQAPGTAAGTPIPIDTPHSTRVELTNNQTVAP